jgi:hypothetical protein
MYNIIIILILYNNDNTISYHITYYIGATLTNHLCAVGATLATYLCSVGATLTNHVKS